MKTQYDNKAGGDTSDHRVVEVPLMIHIVMTDDGDMDRLNRELTTFCQSFVSKGGHLYKRATHWEWVNP